MGLGYDAKSKNLSIAMIVLGLVCFLMIILTVQLKKKIIFILIPFAIILIGYIVTMALLVKHYNQLMKEDPKCAVINSDMVRSDCLINRSKIFVLAGGIISTLILGGMFLVFPRYN